MTGKRTKKSYVSTKTKDQPPNVKFYDEEYLARQLKMSAREFHQKVKPIIKADFSELLKELDSKNPDIGIDPDNMIYLADPGHLKILPTNFSIFDYLCNYE